jgi:hypothetical protein
MKPRVPWVLLVVSAFLCAVTAVPAARADSQVRIVRLSFTDGSVLIDRNTGSFEKAIMNMPIVEGTKLVTETGARAEVELEDGSTVRLGPNAEVDFTQLSLKDDGGKVSAVEVRQGTVYFDITRHKNDEFRVAFAADQVTLDHAARFRVTVGEDKAELAALDSDLKVQGPEEVAVKKGQTLTVDLESGQFAVAKGIAADPLDDWVKAREAYRDRYASNQSYGVPYGGYYGGSDLNYYGNYFYQSGWGWLWRPYYVGYGWDPFYDGAWAWYSGWGYTWVSTYPWGWIPYRYGSWVFVPGWGWAWQPGGWGTWQAVPVVIDPPPAYRPPQPPSTPPVPRGPRPEPRPTILVKSHVPAGDNPTVDILSRPAVRTNLGSGGTSTGILSRTPPANRIPDNNIRPQPAAPGRPVPDRTGVPERSPGTRDTPSPRVDRGPDRDSPSPRVERPSAPSPPPRMETPRSAPPSSPPPRMETPRAERPSSPPPRMEAPRSGPPPSSRMESPHSSAPSRPIK